jgi:hypothetical protein
MSVVDPVLLAIAACLSLVRFCWLLLHICCWSDSVRCFGISVVDPVLFVVQACLLLI